MPNRRRWAIIIGLGVVELWIIGLILRSLSGGHAAAVAVNPAQIGSAQRVPLSGAGVRTITTGPAPDVVIDDEGAALTVTVRSGTSVTVRDRNERSGWVYGNSPVRIEKTSDGVRISRGPRNTRVVIGDYRRRIDVVVPPQTRLDVRNAGSMAVSGLRAAAELHSDDDSIAVYDHRGELHATTGNGRIELRDVIGPFVQTRASDGRTTFDRVRADRVDVVADNGRIEIGRSVVRGGKIQTDHGRVTLGLDPQSNVTISARAASGKVMAAAPLIMTGSGEDDNVPATIRVGSGSGQLDVASGEGSISIRAGEVERS